MIELPPYHRFLAKALVTSHPRVIRLFKMAENFERNEFSVKLAEPYICETSARNWVSALALRFVLKQIFRKDTRLVHYLA